VFVCTPIIKLQEYKMTNDEVKASFVSHATQMPQINKGHERVGRILINESA